MKILIIRLSSLGDIVHTIPAFACIREKLKEAKIAWVVSKKGREILEMVKGLDQIILSPFETGNFDEIYGFDAAIDFQGLIKSGFLTFFSRAPLRYGFAPRLCKEGLAALFYNKKLHDFNGRHVIAKNLALATLLTGQECKLWRFPFEIPSYSELDGIFKNRVIINVGASWKIKRLQPEKVAKVAKELSSMGFESILIWGTEEEKEEAQKASQLSGIPISPFLNLKQLFYAIKISKGVISPDSLVLHAAFALHKPVVGVFGPTDPFRNGPVGHRTAFLFTNEPCAPCWKRKCKNPVCIRKITAEEIAEAAALTFSENPREN